MKYNKIIWISLDTLRADCIPSNRHKLYPKEYRISHKLKRGVLDKVCAEGCFFANTISAAPYTSASHAAYFTGLWPKNNGVYDQFNSKLTAKTIFKTAKESGFKTVFKTDFPFILGKYLNMIKGVDTYLIEDNKKVLDEIKNNKKVFAFIHFGQIHYPYGFHNIRFGGADYRKKIRELEKKYRIDPESVNLSDMAIETFRSKEDLKLLYRYKKIISKLYGKKKDSDLFNLYLEGINYFNEHLFNKFLDKLTRTVENEDYLLIISSDHGEAWNEETYGHHNSLDEGVIRVPVIFKAKDITPQTYTNRIRTIDIVPTLNELMQRKDVCDGKSLCPIIYDGKTEGNRVAFSAVWVNESHVVIKKIKTLQKDDHITFQQDISIKYSAAAYIGKYKYIVNYKHFVNRGPVLENLDCEQVFEISNLTKLTPKKNATVIAEGRKAVESYNDIPAERHNKQKGIMKKYFNLLGYKI